MRDSGGGLLCFSKRSIDPQREPKGSRDPVGKGPRRNHSWHCLWRPGRGASPLRVCDLTAGDRERTEGAAGISESLPTFRPENFELRLVAILLRLREIWIKGLCADFFPLLLSFPAFSWVRFQDTRSQPQRWRPSSRTRALCRMPVLQIQRCRIPPRCQTLPRRRKR